MPKVIIERISEYRNKARKIGIYINGEKAGTISDGEIQVFDVEPGKHQIFAKVDWCGSKKNEIVLSENETKTFVLRGYKYGGVMTQFVLGILLLYYLFKYAFDLQFDFLIVFVLIGFLYQMYFITFGKNNYLNLTEKNKNVLQQRL
ncbi:hypothetical protein J4050_07515 [Winogradskyella sp. DF17]|uniref:PEGA domain-containing protein n=1 Tax=Winogradskyella pelagia TaxID=2819984 RepID=A0ABS3T1G9_9FLAO|nr:hypothetical protein [Winogradskyella sp. DF17]MBO3116588.1 hypothetical protein [Winogradskyella sp. DF17]